MLSKREKTIGVVTGVLLGALVLDQLMLTPLLDRKAAADQAITRVGDDLREAQNLFQNDLRARRNWKQMAGQTLATDAPTAEGQLLNRARAWADDSRLTLTSLKPERSEREQGFQKVTIRATATGSIEQVARFLFAVETADIPVRVADVQLTTRKENTDELTVNLGLATIYLPPEPTRPAPREARR